MVSSQTPSKVTNAHLTRSAYLYVRQSTLRQVLTNTESATRQYALRQRAIALGWRGDQVITIYWHRLLEISALAGTLICDEDGLYDPGEFNDCCCSG